MAQIHHFCDASRNGYGVVLSHNAHVSIQCLCHGKSYSSSTEVCHQCPNGAHCCHNGKLHGHLVKEGVTDECSGVCFGQRQCLNTSGMTLPNAKCLLPTVSQKFSVSQFSQWQYVNNASNPADVDLQRFKSRCISQEWYFLLHPKSRWPINPDDAYQPTSDDPEVKRAFAVNIVQTTIHHFSSWTRFILGF